jgi:hypothetical protein
MACRSCSRVADADSFPPPPPSVPLLLAPAGSAPRREAHGAASFGADSLHPTDGRKMLRTRFLPSMSPPDGCIHTLTHTHTHHTHNTGGARSHTHTHNTRTCAQTHTLHSYQPLWCGAVANLPSRYSVAGMEFKGKGCSVVVYVCGGQLWECVCACMGGWDAELITWDFFFVDRT